MDFEFITDREISFRLSAVIQLFVEIDPGFLRKTGGGVTAENLELKKILLHLKSVDFRIGWEIIKAGFIKKRRRYMKYSNTTIRELNAQYRSVLKKCFMLNAMVLLAVSTAANATSLTEKFVVNEGDQAQLMDTEANGLTSSSAGGAVSTQGGLEISNSSFTNNTTDADGGAIRVDVKNGALTSIQGSTFSGNKAVGYSAADSGAISIGNGDVIIDDSDFLNNEAKVAGAIYAYTGNNHYVNVSIKNSVFEGNSAEAIGAVGNFASARNADTLKAGGMIIENTIFRNNKATSSTSDGAGALFLGSESQTTITGGEFTGNTSASHGGAISMRANDLGNHSTANLDISGVQFTNNTAATEGGAIFNTFYNSKTNPGAVTVASSVFTGNAAATGGAIFNDGTGDVGGHTAQMNLSDVTFTGNNATYRAGAIYNDSGDITVTNGTFTNNTGKDAAGAVMNTGRFTMTGGSFTGNHADVGGAVSDVFEGDNVVTTLSGVEFNNNHAVWDGGAIAAYSKVNISDSSFTGNTAAISADGVVGDPSYSDGGGAIIVGGTSDVTLTNVQFTDNESAVRGGAISARHGKDRTLTLNTVEFTNNKAGNFGGAVASIYQGLVNVQNSQFTGNEAVKAGGAIYIGKDTNYGNPAGVISTNNGTLNLSGENLFTGNTAGEKGGAIYADEGATINLSGTNTFTGNTAEDGGAIFNKGTMTIGDGVQFTDNKSTNNGGAVYNDKNASLTIGNNATFHDNMLIDNGVNHGTDIYNNGGTVVIGDNLTLSRSEEYTSEHDCAFMNKSGSTMTIGQNALFKNVAEVLITEKGTYAIGNNARFENVGNGFSNWGGQITLGDNATFLNGTARALQNANNTTGSITVGANAMFDGNSDVNESNGGGSVIFNGDKATMTFGDGFVAQNNRADEGNSVIYNGTNSTLAFNGSSTFTNNGTSNKSGVIRNWGAVTFDGATTFTGNSADSDGGAIFNGDGATIDFNADATFSGNTIASGANDIHNLGIVNINAGTTTISGGITGETGSLSVANGATLDIGTAKVAQDSITFDAGSTLKANLLNTTSYGSLEANTIAGNGAALNLTVGSAGEYVIAKGTGADSFANAVIDSASLYDIVKTSSDADTLTYMASVKAAEDIASDAGVSTQTASVLSTLANASNDAASQIALNLQNELAAGNKDAVESATTDLAPTNTATVHSVATTVHSQILGAVNNRLATPAMGRSGGDLNAKFGPWVQGLYNKSKQDSSSGTQGFRGYTQGVAFGLDTLINDVYMVGVGYAYNATDVKSGGRKTDIYGHNFFIYGEYQPNAWFVNGTVNYSTSDYKEQRAVTGVGIASKYDVDTWGGQVMTGYDMASGLTPKAGLRYLHIKQDSYTDTLGQNVKTDNTDLLTAVAGVNYAYDFVEQDYTLTPEVRLAATYDIVSDNADATVVMGTGSYTTSGKRLPRFGVEAGVGVTMNMFDALDVSLNYDAGIRRDYTSHTGTVKFKYNF